MVCCVQLAADHFFVGSFFAVCFFRQLAALRYARRPVSFSAAFGGRPQGPQIMQIVQLIASLRMADGRWPLFVLSGFSRLALLR